METKAFVIAADGSIASTLYLSTPEIARAALRQEVTFIEPPEAPSGQSPRFDRGSKTWSFSPDFRGRAHWNPATGDIWTTSLLGEIPPAGYEPYPPPG